MNGRRGAGRLLCLALAAASSWTGVVNAASLQLGTPGDIGLAIADLNSDGRPDVVALNREAEAIEVFLATGFGRFDRNGPFAAYEGSSPLYVVGGRVDPDDRHVDLVTHRGDVGGGGDLFTILYGTGTGGVGFTQGLVGETESGASGNAVADCDGDGLLDRVQATWDGHLEVAYIFTSTNLGRLRVPSGVPYARVVVPCDADGDGMRDVAVWGKLEPTCAIFRGAPGRTFRDPIVIESSPGPGGETVRGAAADLDGDGRDEVVLLSYLELDGVQLGYLYLVDLGEDGSATMRRIGTPLRLRHFYHANLGLSDLDGDGRPDVLLQGQLAGYGDGVWILRNETTTSPAFRLHGFLPYDGLGTSFAVTDLDGDGSTDVLLATREEGRIEIVDSAWGSDRVLALSACHDTLDVPGDGAIVAARTAAFLGSGAEEVVVAGSGAARILSFGFEGATEAGRIAIPETAADMAAADLDGDGDPDLVVSDPARSAVEVRYLARVRAAGNALVLEAGGRTAGVEVADLDGDGRVDIAAALPDRGEIAVLWQLEAGAFGLPSRFPAGESPKVVRAGDLDGDGILDLAATNAGTSRVAILKGLGGRAFATPQSPRVVTGPTDLEIADLDGDGREDLAVVSAELGGFVVLLGAEGGFDPWFRYLPHGLSPSSVRAVDLDADGDRDLAVAVAGGENELIFRNEGNGRFGEPELASLGFREIRSDRHLLVVGDLDRNGLADLATADAYSGALRVHYGRRCGPETRFRRGDVDGDGFTTVADAVSILIHVFLGGPRPRCEDAADANDGGQVDVADPVYLLNFLFLGGPAPPAPGPAECGPDATADGLSPCEDLCF